MGYRLNFLISLLIVFNSKILFGQVNYQDVVYLKNGSIIRGIIIEQVPNKSIKIETADRNVFVYEIEEIEKFTKEEIKNNIKNNNNTTAFSKGYRGILECGYQIGTGTSPYGKVDRLKISFINGYQVNPYFSIGFGTGLRLLSESQQLVVPIFTNLKVHFINDNFSPYMAVDLGYAIRLSGLQYENLYNDLIAVNPRNGLHFSSAIGVSFGVSNKSAINIGMGLDMLPGLAESKDEVIPNRIYTNTLDLWAYNLSIGISF